MKKGPIIAIPLIAILLCLIGLIIWLAMYFTKSSDQGNPFPFVVYLYIQKAVGFENCVGTLIGRRTILTAAHCVDGADNVWILLGTKYIRKSKKNKVVKSNNFTIHKHYNTSTLDNDIAVIYLDEEIKLDEHVNKISISVIPLQNTSKESYVVLGWGDSIQGLNEEILVKNVSVLDSMSCSSIVDEYESKICAIGKKGPCHGDSGGPLLLGKIQIGIVSWGDRDCNKSLPTVYTDVGFYSNWIKHKLIV